ncbi:uncharacterized protein [Panulirus ornatus]|uniref:uncharacterized protein n=1 Tax=Panulirus ornatus TaxID=150431 RepID=UPI003A852504
MEALVVLALTGVVSAAPTFLLPYPAYTGGVVGVHAPVVPVSYASQHHAQDELGQVNYGFAHFGQAKNEIRDAFGNVAGVYTYIDANNDPVHVQYTAGADGFRVKSNNLPVAPGSPDVDLPVAPEPVMDTPEVAAAKLEFFEAFNAAAAAAAAAADEDSVPEAPVAEEEPVTETPVAEDEESVTEAPAAEVEEAVTDAPAAAEEEAPEEETTEEEASVDPAPLTAPEPVMDTEEVAAAKADFLIAYEAAAAAAAAGTLPEVVVPTGAPESVVDTDEVAAAKAEFQAAYEAAAAAAEAAANFDLDGSISHYTGHLSAVDGVLPPVYTNTLLHGDHFIHTPTHVHYDPYGHGPYNYPIIPL